MNLLNFTTTFLDKRILFIAVASLLPVGCEHSLYFEKPDVYTVATVPNPKRVDAASFVSNPDSILSVSAVRQINAVLRSLEADTKAEVAVVMLNSIGDAAIEDFARQLFNTWGIGKAELNNGFLILFVLDQRAVRFEVGYGLESTLPDNLCAQIQMEAMIPEFKTGNYDAGISAGVTRVASRIRKAPMNEAVEAAGGAFAPGGDANELPPINWHIWLSALGLFYALALFFLLFAERHLAKEVRKDASLPDNQKRYEAFVDKKRQKVSLGCLKSIIMMLLPIPGVFMLFIGAVDIDYLWLGLILCGSLLLLVPEHLYKKLWEKRFRRQPFPCPRCTGEMRYLSEWEDNQHLELSADMEDSLKSVDSDVFWCKYCQQGVVYRYDNEASEYKNCPQCQTKAFYLANTETVTYASYDTCGLAHETYVCKFCNHTQVVDKQLERLIRNSKSRAAGRSSGGFGGGRSGGHGSTGRW
ncbi:hypothetical protein SAMD00024442_3_54 [Candidatus Symbiothrix dinenymphae]|nr:hypothetical protein SAMD00024442_3_54 [Candidatus Symbiothrix dinenymphae]